MYAHLVGGSRVKWVAFTLAQSSANFDGRAPTTLMRCGQRQTVATIFTAFKQCFILSGIRSFTMNSLSLSLIHWGPYCLGWALARFYVWPHKSKILSNTEKNDISFETPDRWLLDSWRTGAWQVHMLATPSVCKKCTFQEKRAWQQPEPATPLFPRSLKANYQGSQMVYNLFLCYWNFQK